MGFVPYEKLDDFQKSALRVLKKGHNLILSAPTGTGKTAVVDHISIEYIKRGKIIFYTSPLKALCNQKFREFSELLGHDLVGLITGDEVVNEWGSLLVMTTEILRNRLQEGDIGKTPDLVVFDEIHYLADSERGTTWEEAIVLLPPDVQIVGLSATCPNADELAKWIEGIKERKTEVILHHERAVPLELYGFSRRGKLIPLKRATKIARSSRAPYKSPNHIEIIELLKDKDMLPALYFLFNRKKVEEFARELAKWFSFTTKEEEREIEKTISQIQLDSELKPFLRRIKPLLKRGIGFHHAGLLPGIKRIVEVLFERKLLKVVYCTSTFALGVNMPARTVCLDSVYKFDGETMRPLKNLEFFQKAGRAGRRGIDERGFVVVRFDPRDMEFIPDYTEKNIEPIESAFKLSYNSLINLLRRKTLDEIMSFLSSSFWSFQKEKWKMDTVREIERLKEELESLPSFQCKYSNELFEEKKELIRRRIELLKTKLESIREGIKKEGISERKRRRMLLKEKNLTKEIERMENELLSLDPLNCEFCENRGKCMKIMRKRASKEKRIRLLEMSLKALSEKLKRELDGKVMVLKELGYVDENLDILVGGKILSKIHIEELTVAEIILEGLVSELSAEELVALFTSIGKAGDRGGVKARSLPKSLKRDVNDIVSYVSSVEKRFLEKPNTKGVNWGFWEVGMMWAEGRPVKEMVERLGMYEGDLISSMKQGKDLLTQVKRVYEMELSGEPRAELMKVRDAIALIDRPFLREFSDEN